MKLKIGNQCRKSKSQNVFKKKISKVYKPLARLTKKNRENNKLLILGMKERPSLLIPWTLTG